MAGLKFEEALKKLEAIVEELEEAKISLEDSIKKYEEGIKLAGFCAEKLEEAERKIEIVAKDSSGKMKRQPFRPRKETDSSKNKSSNSPGEFLF